MKRLSFPAWLGAVPLVALFIVIALTQCGYAKGPAVVTLPDGLKYTDVRVGKGPIPARGQTVSVHYVGRLTDGTKFDSSRDRGVPFEFALGEGQVIAGWDEGVKTMHVGGIRRLVIPAKLGYGDQGAGDKIPPNATLLFEIELLSIK